MELSAQEQITGLRMQNSCIRLQLKKVKHRYSHLERLAQGTPEPCELTDQDIKSCVNVLSYLTANPTEIDTYKFAGVTNGVESAYRSRIIKAFVGRAYIKKKKKIPSHISYVIDEERRKNCLMRVRKNRRQVIPTTSGALVQEEPPSSAQLQEMETGEYGEESDANEIVVTNENVTQSGDDGAKEKVLLERVAQVDAHRKKLAADDVLLIKKACYICHKGYQVLHFFYGTMCPSCAELNYAKRIQESDLTGKIAIVTGGRIKVGYATALKLLRCGAHVVVTTRFPRHALVNYSKESDFNSWRDRLRLYGPLDMSDIRSVENFVEYIKTNFNELHILINNAAQTVSRPPEYYSALLQLESTPVSELSKKIFCILPPETTTTTECTDVQVQGGSFASEITWEGEVIDMRTKNSWTSTIDYISTTELMEVHTVNVIAPFILCSKLKPLMGHTQGMKFMINVSAMEGQFYKRYKEPTHPHTNMAKAALNMMTRTAAIDLASFSIYLNSVDPGWVSHMGPSSAFNRCTHGLETDPPIDAIDGAARVLDPIFQALKGNAPLYGLFLKDYADCAW